MVFIPMLIFFILILLASAIKICGEYERAFVFRLERLILPPKGPGVVFLIVPIIDKVRKINLRSARDLEAAERLLREAKIIQKDANVKEIDRFLKEFAEIRKNLGPMEESQQRLGVTWGNVIRIWWSYCWRLTAFTVIISGGIFGIANLLLKEMDRRDLVGSVGLIIIFLVSILVSIIVLKKILSKRFEKFSIVLVPH